MTRSYPYFRLTLNCAHLVLREAGTDPDLRIGRKVVCWVCPLRKDPTGMPGQVAAVRQVVDIEQITLRRRPDDIGSEWDH